MVWRAIATSRDGNRTHVTVAVGGEADDYVADYEAVNLLGLTPAVKEGHVFLVIVNGDELVIKLTADQANEIGKQLIETSTELRLQRPTPNAS